MRNNQIKYKLIDCLLTNKLLHAHDEQLNIIVDTIWLIFVSITIKLIVKLELPTQVNLIKLLVI